MRLYRFGPFAIDEDERVLRRDGNVIPLTPKAAALLLMMLERRGRTVSKEEILRHLWPDTFVEEGNLGFQIFELRRALSDRAIAPEYVATAHGRGYRFIAPVDVVESDAQPVSGTPTRTPARRAFWLVSTAALAVVAVGVLAIARPEPADFRVTRIVRVTHDESGKHSLRLVGSTRAVVTWYDKQTIRRLDDGSVASLPVTDGYRLLDVEPSSEEALAVRADDPGADHGLWILSLQSGSARRVAMVRTDGTAAWAHGAQRIAYTFRNTLFTADRNGADVRELMTFSDEPQNPGWSPDNTIIRFTRHSLSDRVSVSNLWDINANGSGGLRQLLPGIAYNQGGSWIPGTNGYVFELIDRGRHEISIVRQRRGWGFGDRTPTVTSLAADPSYHEPVASADGRRIFVLKTGRARLERFDPIERRFSPYLGGISAYRVQFSQDGRSVLYLTYPDGRLWRGRADGTGAVPYDLPSMTVGAASWSPDGQWIALRASTPGKRAKVYLLPSEGGSPEPLVADDIEQGVPSWSADGRFLAYGDVPETFGTPTGAEAIHIFDRELRTLSTLPGSAALWTSRWSPDGRFLAALTIVGQRLKLYDVRARQWRDLGIDHVSDPTWSRDSQWIYCFPEAKQFWIQRIRVADGKVEPIVDVSTFSRPISDVGLSWDGSPLILRTPVDIYALELTDR
jgi:DNA-binding winged helix-turn-helix (wHTH) protein/Tol biopolymer transport system component